MHARPANLFQRLRLHKVAWMLWVAAMLIKIVTATACLLDAPGALASSTAPGTEQTLAMTAADGNEGDQGCLLGEKGDCHCACAHAATLPATVPMVTMVLVPRLMPAHPPVAPTLRTIVSPLRPPIA